MPVAIPVYMTIELSTAIGLVGGTKEDFRKVRADIEEQMKDAVTEVANNEGTARRSILRIFESTDQSLCTCSVYATYKYVSGCILYQLQTVAIVCTYSVY